MLTQRQQEVAYLVGEGLTTAEIAQRLFIAPGTVRNVITVCLSTLHLTNRAQLAAWAARNHISATLATDGRPVSDPDNYRELVYTAYAKQ